MAQALYRRYRSKSLDDVIGQKHITGILKQALKTDKISHAYLFTGPRGVGKTSVARILAHQINESDYENNSANIDIIEIDAASNNSVEDIRDLREKVQIAPVFSKKKVYIIDEVHMLTKSAFNALLKTLEEPPEHIVFILATTNLEKLPSTIISRAQHFAFRPIGVDDIVSHLSYIAKQENIKISDNALKLIALRGDGSFRDSISLLDQLTSLKSDENNEINESIVEQAIGIAPTKLVDDIISSAEIGNLEMIVSYVDKAVNNGVDLKSLIEQILHTLKYTLKDKNNLLPIFNSLINIKPGQYLDFKLISALSINIPVKKQSKVIALNASTAEITMDISEYKKPITKQIISLHNETVTDPTLQKEAKAIAPIVEKKAPPKDFNWNNVVETARKNYVAVYSVLSKCAYEVNGSILTLYTMNAFYKKKLDDTKYSPLLAKCLQETGVYGMEIITIPTPPPLKDSQAAAIAAIMGGGQEVKVES